jgi:hypothetical protein
MVARATVRTTAWSTRFKSVMAVQLESIKLEVSYAAMLSLRHVGRTASSRLVTLLVAILSIQLFEGNGSKGA